MKKILLKYGHFICSLTMLITVYASNRVCHFIFHQPKFPDSGKNLGKH